MRWPEALMLALMVGAFLALFLARLPPVLASLRLRWRDLHRLPNDTTGWVTTTARVADIYAVDVGEAHHTQTMYRVVLLFSRANGEAIAVERTCSLGERELDALLPDAHVPIAYDPRDPERLELHLGEPRPPVEAPRP